MNHPFRICLRVGEDFVASDRHFLTHAAAEKVRQEILQSPTFRAQEYGSVGIRIMHWHTFRKLCDNGTGVTMARLRQNERRFGKEFAGKSKLYLAAEALNSLVTALNNLSTQKSDK